MPIRARTLASVAVFMMPACVIKLVDRNSPAENGAVTGPPADCSKLQVKPAGSIGGDAAPKFVGRFATAPGDTPDAPPSHVFDWSGSYITVRFQGTDRITVKLSLMGQTPQDQMFDFVVDDRPPTDNRQITVRKNAAGVPTNIPLEEYEILGLDKNAPHEVTIYKNTEAQKGSILFKGFDLHGGTVLPPTRRARRIEFIGDSITCGYGDEGKNATCPFEVTVRDATDENGNVVKGPDGEPIKVTVPVTERQYLSFTALAARELDADAVTICWSGKGVYKNYKERFVRTANGRIEPEADTKTTVPQLWETRTVGNDNQGNKWDFATEPDTDKPDVVVITLGTNDFARDTLPESTDPKKLSGDNIPDKDMENPVELENFYRTYVEFVRKVRQYRPNAHIFLATSPMLSDQFPFDNARSSLRSVLLRVAAAVDPKVYQMDLVEAGFRYGLGCDYHPNLEVHRIMARQLVGAIRSKTCWAR